MADTPVQECNVCTASKPLTTEFFGIDKSQESGFRQTCKRCFNDKRSKKKSPELKALARLEQIVKDAHAALADPATPFSIRHKADQTIRNADKRRQKLLKPIEEQRKAAETAARLAVTSPSLVRVQAQFYHNPFAQSHTDLPQMVVEMRAVLVGLVAPSDELAHAYLTKLIATVEAKIVADAADAQEKADTEQNRANGWATQRALGNIHDTYLPLIRQAKTPFAKNALRTQLWKMKRGAQNVATNSTEKDDTGAQKSVVALALAKEFDRMARMLYGGTKPMAASDTLENITSRIDQANIGQQWLEQAERDRQKYWSDLLARDPDQHARESKSLILQTKGDGPLAQMARDAARKLKRENPEAYTRQALAALKPRKVTQDTVVWRVPTEKGIVWMWSDGREVRHGGDVQHAEIIKDARLGWVLNPSPLGAEIDDGPPAKMELIQDPMDCDEEGYPRWKWVAEGSTGIHEQQSDGSYKRVDTPSPWGKATRVTFRDAEPPASPEHSIFRYGGFWTPAQVQAAEGGPDLETPPVILPPLTRVVTDSIATEPPPNAIQLERMNRVAETPWQRHERKQREQKLQESALLRGTYVWNFAS